ncbi:MAG: ABC transporter ATP-binding protein [Bacilli bacterium]|nr:ABC transporter ATP-binding protein [Bacilli bacterium]
MEEKDLLVEANELTMKFRLANQKVNNLKEMFVKLVKRSLRYRDFYALKNVSLKIYRGEGLAIIGRNGSGKSTLLKILTQIIRPTSGRVKLYTNNIIPLLQLGAGFDMNSTGYQNVYLNGAILGYTKKEIDKKMNEIIQFSELQDFMNVELKNYSQGMLARLGFAIAISCEPEILIVDEILAVGDTAFQKKCYQKLHELKEKGTTFIIVSHSDVVKELCTRAIWLKDGEKVMDDDIDKVYSSYMEYLSKGN